jgi:polar amino acid transport system permease protein
VGLLGQLLPPLLQGLRVTLLLTAGAALLALAAAFGAGLARRSRRRALRLLSVTYVELFRGTSALVQLFWAYFVLPLFGLELSAELTGILALGLNAGAYGAEIVRGAVSAVPRGQWEAAAVLGMSERTTLLRVALPQALPRMLPPFNNLMIELLKNTALVSMITLSDLTFQAQALRASTMRTPEIFGLLLALYFAIALLITAGFRRLERIEAISLREAGARR